MGKFLRDVGVAVLSGLGVRLGLQVIEKAVEKVEEAREKVRVDDEAKKRS